MSYPTLTIFSSDESLESRDHTFTYQELITENGNNILSPATTFKITIVQEKCKGVTLGSYLTSDINPPKHGANSGAATSLLLDGSTVVLTLPDYGDENTFFFEQKSTFDASDSRCGPRLLTVAVGSPSWLTATQDGGDSSKFLINAKPNNIANTV